MNSMRRSLQGHLAGGIAILMYSAMMMPLSACHKASAPPPTPVESAYWRINPNPSQPAPETLDLITSDIQRAPSAGAEADAIQRLHQYEVDHELTYQVSGVRVDTNIPVKPISAQRYLVRVDVSVFRGQQPIYSFSFIPRDNRNVALLEQ